MKDKFERFKITTIGLIIFLLATTMFLAWAIEKNRKDINENYKIEAGNMAVIIMHYELNHDTLVVDEDKRIEILDMAELKDWRKK